MTRLLVIASVCLLVALAGCSGVLPSNDATSTPTPSPTTDPDTDPDLTPSPTASSTPTLTSVPTATGSKNGSLTAQRTLSKTQVTTDSTITVTVEATFQSSINDATLADTIDGKGISEEDLSLTDPSGSFGVITSDPQPTVDLTWSEALNFGLGNDSVTITYELTIPEDTPVGTTITFDGTVTNSNSAETTTIDGDTQLEIVAASNTTSSSRTVTRENVPAKFLSETNGIETIR